MSHYREKADQFLRTVSFVTGNHYKAREVAQVLGAVRHIDVDLPEIQELDPRKVVLAKAKAAVERGYSPVLVDDTSMSLSGMNGLPGPLIKWFLKALGAEGMYRLAAHANDFRAEVRTIFGLAMGPQTILYGEASIAGEIVIPRGGDFGWDAIFQPGGGTKTLGEMTAEEKQAISIRRDALLDLRNQLERFHSVYKR